MSDNSDYDHEKYTEVIQKFLDVMWRDPEELVIGENISDIPEIKIIFDGHGDLEETDENGDYVYTERGNTNMESYAIFIHKDSGKKDFEFPEHDMSPFGLYHRPDEEVCLYAWFDVELDEWSINSLYETSDHKMTNKQVMKILDTINKRYWHE